VQIGTSNGTLRGTRTWSRTKPRPGVRGSAPFTRKQKRPVHQCHAGFAHGSESGSDATRRARGRISRVLHRRRRSWPYPGIALVSFTLNPDTITGEGPYEPGTDVSFEVGIDTPAPPGGVQVDIFAFDALLLSVWVPDGDTTGSLVVTFPGDTPVGDYELEARLGGAAVTAVLHVVPAS
jgi:hypothetical protein